MLRDSIKARSVLSLEEGVERRRKKRWDGGRKTDVLTFASSSCFLALVSLEQVTCRMDARSTGSR